MQLLTEALDLGKWSIGLRGRNIRSVSNDTRTRGVKSLKSTRDDKRAKGVKNIRSARDDKRAKGVKDIRSARDDKRTRGVKNIQSVKGVATSGAIRGEGSLEVEGKAGNNSEG